MLQPKRTKFRKQQKGRNRGLALRGSKVNFGEFGLKSVERGRLTARQIEAARRAMTRHIKRGGKIWIRIFPDKPITKKPLEVRMGKGKGNVEYWVSVIKPGRILYEIEGISEELAKEQIRLRDEARARETAEAARAEKEALMARARVFDHSHVAMMERAQVFSDLQNNMIYQRMGLGKEFIGKASEPSCV